MKKFILIAALSVTAVPAFAGKQIVASCERGSTYSLIIEDRGGPRFYQSLIDFGYKPERAIAIADHICRDRRWVRNMEAAREEVLRTIRESPPH